MVMGILYEGLVGSKWKEVTIKVRRTTLYHVCIITCKQ